MGAAALSIGIGEIVEKSNATKGVKYDYRNDSVEIESDVAVSNSASKQTDGEIKNYNPSLAERFKGSLLMDWQDFTNPSLPSDRLNVFMKYGHAAVDILSAGGAAKTAGVGVAAHAGKNWHIGLDLANKRNIIHLGNSTKNGGVHLGLGYRGPNRSWFHLYFTRPRPWTYITPK
jgi:hypothetical protein